MIPSDKLLRAMLVKESATTVHQTLVRQGYDVSRSRCRTVRSVLFAEGTASPAPYRNNKPPEAVSYADPALEAEMGSSNLLKAIERYYAHYAFTHGCSVPAARLVLNYSRAQIEKMAA